MWLPLIPVACAVFAAGVAIGIASQNRRWVKADRAADRAEAARAAELAAQLDAQRKVAEEMYGLLPARRSKGIAGIGDFASAVRAGLVAVEPLCSWAFALPLGWRLRVDGLAFLIGHRFDWENLVSDQLRRDLSDLLNGRDRPREMDADLVDRFTFFLEALLETDRYCRDPETRDLSREFRRVSVVEILSEMGHQVSWAEACKPESLELVAFVTGHSRFVSAIGPAVH